MYERIEKKLNKIAKAIIKYKDFYNKDLYKKNFYWKSKIKKNSLRDSEIGALISNFDIEDFMNKVTDDMQEDNLTVLLKKEYQPRNKFNIGDKVDFINDYGVISKEHTITNFTLYEFGGYLYDTDKNSTPWF